jgi:hypothetical protein
MKLLIYHDGLMNIFPSTGSLLFATKACMKRSLCSQRALDIDRFCIYSENSYSYLATRLAKACEQLMFFIVRKKTVFKRKEKSVISRFSSGAPKYDKFIGCFMLCKYYSITYVIAVNTTKCGYLQ